MQKDRHTSSKTPKRQPVTGPLSSLASLTPCTDETGPCLPGDPPYHQSPFQGPGRTGGTAVSSDTLSAEDPLPCGGRIRSSETMFLLSRLVNRAVDSRAGRCVVTIVTKQCTQITPPLQDVSTDIPRHASLLLFLTRRRCPDITHSSALRCRGTSPQRACCRTRRRRARVPQRQDPGPPCRASSCAERS